MPRIFEKIGVRFAYPDNWIIDESESGSDTRAVTLYSPDGGFWSLMVHPPTSSPKELVAAAVQAMREEYDQLDSADIAEVVGERQVVGADLNFFCLDLTNTAMVRSFRTPSATIVVFCQAEDRDFAALEPVFRAMTQSAAT